jgi:hypothetical protein
MVVTDGKIVVWIRLRGVADKIRDVIADADEGRLKTTADEACDDGKHADGEETDENFIVIMADKEVDRCCFPLPYLLEYDSCKSHVFP